MKRTITKEYDGPTALMRDAKSIQCSIFGRSHFADFNGATIEETLDRVHGWPGGLEKLASLPGWDTPPQRGQWIKRWSEDDGDTWDQERYLDERPFLSKRIRAAGGQRKTRNLDIVINIGENADVTARQMLWKTYAACKVIDEMENNGIRCRVMAVMISENPGPTTEIYRQTIILKDYQDPLNASLIVSWIAPWTLRYWTFKTLTKHVPNVHNSKGSAKKLGKIPGALVLDNGECLSEQSAKRWIEEAQQETNRKESRQ